MSQNGHLANPLPLMRPQLSTWFIKYSFYIFRNRVAVQLQKNLDRIRLKRVAAKMKNGATMGGYLISSHPSGIFQKIFISRFQLLYNLLFFRYARCHKKYAWRYRRLWRRNFFFLSLNQCTICSNIYIHISFYWKLHNLGGIWVQFTVDLCLISKIRKLQKRLSKTFIIRSLMKFSCGLSWILREISC